MKWPKISIITPNFNGAPFIEQTLCSVLDQGYPNLEYIVIDGGSTDQSVEIIQKYEKHLQYWTSERDQGQSDAINKGLKLCSGEIINWLNSDDYYEPQALTRIAQIYQEHQPKVICGRSRIFNSETNETLKISSGTDIYLKNLEKTIGWARIDQPETFFSKDGVMKMGSLNTDLHYIMDRVWWIQYLLHVGLKDVYQTNEVWVNFRSHPNSKTNKFSPLFESENISFFAQVALVLEERLIEKFFHSNYQVKKDIDFPELKELSPQKLALLKKALQYQLILLADIAYANANWNIAQECLQHVDIRSLDQETLGLFRKLKFRLSYLPRPLIKALRMF